MEKSNLPFFQYDDHLSVLDTPFFHLCAKTYLLAPPHPPLAWLGLAGYVVCWPSPSHAQIFFKKFFFGLIFGEERGILKKR